MALEHLPNLCNPGLSPRAECSECPATTLHFTSLLQCPALLCECSTLGGATSQRQCHGCWCKAALLQAAPMGVAQPGAAGMDATLSSKQAQGDKQEQELITLLKWRTKNKMKRRREMLCWQLCLQIRPLKHQPALGAVQCPGGMAGAVQSSLSAFQPCAASDGASSNEIQWAASWHWSLETKTNLWASLELRFPLFSF